jgi:hypothetical protein
VLASSAVRFVAPVDTTPRNWMPTPPSQIAQKLRPDLHARYQARTGHLPCRRRHSSGVGVLGRPPRAGEARTVSRVCGRAHRRAAGVALRSLLRRHHGSNARLRNAWTAPRLQREPAATAHDPQTARERGRRQQHLQRHRRRVHATVHGNGQRDRACRTDWSCRARERPSGQHARAGTDRYSAYLRRLPVQQHAHRVQYSAGERSHPHANCVRLRQVHQPELPRCGHPNPVQCEHQQHLQRLLQQPHDQLLPCGRRLRQHLLLDSGIPRVRALCDCDGAPQRQRRLP